MPWDPDPFVAEALTTDVGYRTPDVAGTSLGTPLGLHVAMRRYAAPRLRAPDYHALEIALAQIQDVHRVAH